MSWMACRILQLTDDNSGPGSGPGPNGGGMPGIGLQQLEDVTEQHQPDRIVAVARFTHRQRADQIEERGHVEAAAGRMVRQVCTSLAMMSIRGKRSPKRRDHAPEPLSSAARTSQFAGNRRFRA